MTQDSNDHFDQTPRRRAEFVTPPNLVKAKVGSGGLSADILAKAQEILESNTVDFAPLAETYLGTLAGAIDVAQHGSIETENAINGMIYPAMQLKANGAMFHYPLVTMLADKMVQFLEVIDQVDRDVIDLGQAFVVTIRAVMASQIREPKHPQGQELLSALDGACRRYFMKHPQTADAV